MSLADGFYPMDYYKLFLIRTLPFKEPETQIKGILRKGKECQGKNYTFCNIISKQLTVLKIRYSSESLFFYLKNRLE
jgi:hypothetical protein